MEAVKTTYWTLLTVIMVTSKLVCLHVEDDSSESSESSELMSSEETDVQSGPSQPELTDTDVKADQVDSIPPSSTLGTAALPVAEDPQTSTDREPLQPLPENPCQNAFSVDNSHSNNQDSPGQSATSKKRPTGTRAYECLQQEATQPGPSEELTPTLLSSSTDTPLSTPAEDSPGFTAQLTTPEPAPPRGDSI